MITSSRNLYIISKCWSENKKLNFTASVRVMKVCELCLKSVTWATVARGVFGCFVAAESRVRGVATGNLKSRKADLSVWITFVSLHFDVPWQFQATRTHAASFLASVCVRVSEKLSPELKKMRWYAFAC